MALSDSARRRRRSLTPLQTALAKVSAYLDHSQTTGDLTAWTSSDGNNASANASRAPAAGASAGNGTPIATFVSANNDAIVWPLNAANNSTTKTGFALWLRQPVSTTEVIITLGAGTNGATANKLRFFLQTSRRLMVDAFISGGDARRGTTPVNALPAAGTWTWVRFFYDSSGATEADRLKIYVDGVGQALTFSSIGGGGTTGVLPTVTGNAIIGNLNDGVSVTGFNGDLGPRLYSLTADLTAAEDAALRAVKAAA